MRPLVPLHDESPAGVSAPPRRLTPALLAIAGLYALIFAACLMLAAVLKPYSDGYSFIDDAWRWRDGGQTFLAYLWEPHVGHHMVWVRLVAALEVSATKSAWPSVVACTVAFIGAAVVLGLRAWNDRRLTSLRLPSALLCAMLVLTGFNALDADQPLNALYPYCLVFAVLSLSLWEVGDAPPPEATLRRILALASAMAAALGNAAGLALWPILIATALLFPVGRWIWSAAAYVGGGLFSFAYVSGAGQVAILSAEGGGADTGAVRRLAYLLDYLALPWSQISEAAGPLLGLAVCAVTAWAIVVSRRRQATAADRFAWSLIAFTLVTAVLAAAGRGGMGEALRTPMRYAVFTAPLHAGVVMLLAPEVERRWPGRAWAIGLGAVALLFVQQAGGVVPVLKSSDRIRAVIADYEAGRRTPAMTPLIYPDLVFADRVEARLRAERSFGKAPGELAPPAAVAPTSGGARTP